MNTLDAIPLSDDLVWTEELDWLPVEQSTDYTIGGSLVIQEAIKLAGRPINLNGVVPRALLLSLRAAASQPIAHTLTINGTAYAVRWRYSDSALTARALVDYADPTDDDLYDVTLRFVEIQP